jgi:hypothetical protein
VDGIGISAWTRRSVFIAAWNPAHVPLVDETAFRSATNNT